MPTKDRYEEHQQGQQRMEEDLQEKRKNTSMQGYSGMKGKLTLNCQWEEVAMFEQGGGGTR